MDNRLTLHFSSAFLTWTKQHLLYRLMFSQTPNFAKNGNPCRLSARQASHGKPAIYTLRVTDKLTRSQFSDRL